MVMNNFTNFWTDRSIMDITVFLGLSAINRLQDGHCVIKIRHTILRMTAFSHIFDNVICINLQKFHFPIRLHLFWICLCSQYYIETDI